LWAVFCVQAVVNRLVIADLSKRAAAARGDWPSASIVVPARDEEKCIREAVSSFLRQDYPGLEVIVVDDGSTDRTPAILAELQGEFDNLRVVPGCDPPDGWLGKPNALEMGRKEATGDWLLFADADVVYEPGLLRRAIGYCLDRDVAMLVAFPRLITRGVLEAALMSSLYLVPFAAFPAYLISRPKRKLFSVGGGAFNLVRRDALEACDAFESLKDIVVDDVGLGYRVKRAGFPIHLVVAGPLARIRMYAGARATVQGFSKNVYPGLVQRPWLIPVVFIMGLVISLLPYGGFVYGLAVGSFSVPACVALVLMHAVLGGLVLWLRQPWYVAFLNPVRELGWMWIVLRSMVLYYRRGLIWRGRNYGAMASR
jgi:glycosyltransferase involved in cell wall biosynthesis